MKEDIRIKNEWRETYIRSIKQINKILKNATSPNFLQSPRFAKTESLKFPIQIIDATSSSLNRSYKKRRVATPNEKPIDLNNLTVLENLHHQMKSMLKLKKALNFKTHQDQCKENSKFLNSLMEDQNKKFYIISLQTPSGVKLIGATKDIFLKRRKSANLRIEPKIKQKKRNSLSINHKKEENEDNQYKVAIQSKIENIKENSQSFKKTYIRARSLSINNINISFGDKIKNQISYTTKHPEFQNGRRLKKKFYKPLKKKN